MYSIAGDVLDPWAIEGVCTLLKQFVIFSVSFDPCPTLKSFTVEGAVLVSQVTEQYTKFDSTCTLDFQVSMLNHSHFNHGNYTFSKLILKCYICWSFYDMFTDMFTLFFQAKSAEQTFLLQFTNVDIRQSAPCVDHLSIYGSNPDIPVC